jgi:ribosomal protein S18 acetylase RimI-like enzyme
MSDEAHRRAHIRPFRSDDADSVNRVAVAAWDRYRTVFSDWPRTAPNFADSARLAGELELLIAEEGAELRGFVGYVAPGRPREKIFKRDWATLRMLSVDPIARGRGIGRQLTEECIRRARLDRASIIALHTSPVMQVALAMYIRMGFAHLRDIVDRHGVKYAVYALQLAV